jgi:hypothetical protein
MLFPPLEQTTQNFPGTINVGLRDDADGMDLFHAFQEPVETGCAPPWGTILD